MTALHPVVDDLWRVELGVVNAYLWAHDGGLVLIDAGRPGDGDAILSVARSLGRGPVTDIVVTHHHPDHAGALAAVLRATDALAWMHPADAAEVRRGNGFRPYRTALGVLGWALDRLVVRALPTAFEPAPVAREVSDGDALPGGFRAVWAPGHSAGQIALYHDKRRLLVAADACSNLPVRSLSVLYEDLATGRATLQRLAALDAETAVFGHGKPILIDARAQLRKAFSQAPVGSAPALGAKTPR